MMPIAPRFPEIQTGSPGFPRSGRLRSALDSDCTFWHSSRWIPPGAHSFPHGRHGASEKRRIERTSAATDKAFSSKVGPNTGCSGRALEMTGPPGSGEAKSRLPVSTAARVVNSKDLRSQCLQKSQCETLRLFQPALIPRHRLQKVILGRMCSPLTVDFVSMGPTIRLSRRKENGRKVCEKWAKGSTLAARNCYDLWVK